MEQTGQNLEAGMSCAHPCIRPFETRSRWIRLRKCGLKCHAEEIIYALREILFDQ